MAHEKLGAHYEETPKSSSNRSFGLVLAVVFTLVAALPQLSGKPPRLWAFAVAGGFAVLAFAHPAALAPLNRVWTKFGLLLHRVMNPLILGIIFVVTIVPIGLLLRLAGKDLLRLKRDRTLSSYWIERRPAGPDPKSLNRQF